MCTQLFDPKVDYIFKNIFGSEKHPKILISFLNACIKSESPITDVSIKNTEITKEYMEESFSRLDVLATTQDGEVINIEMQRADEKNMVKRSLYYWSKIFSAEYKGKGRYSSLPRTICINVLDFNLLDEEHFHNTYILMNKENNNLLTEIKDEFFKEIIDPCMKWLYNSAPSKDNRWTSIVVENNDFPCAEWWKYKSEQYSTMPFNPTPALIGQTMLFTSPNSKYYEKAEKLLVNVLKQYFTNNVSDKYSLHSFYLLFKALRDLEYTNDFIDECYQKWLQDINYSLTREKEKFGSASACLIFDIVNEDSLLQGLFKQEIEDNLDYIIESRTNTGLWVPNYRWGNDDSYYDLAVILWASHLAIKNLVILNNFDRLEENCFA